MQNLSQLHGNSILIGQVDCYCSVCENSFSLEDAYKHMKKPFHKKNINMAVRVEKFKDDQIIKVKKGYYCPFCNILLSTTSKASIHIEDINHRESKKAPSLTRVGDYIVAFDETVISKTSWHGLMDNTCVICNVEFDSNENHVQDSDHIVKLIQSKCEFGHKYVYRKVDEDSFFCLICGRVFSISEKLTHHENSDHKKFYSTGKELKQSIPLSTQVDKTNVMKKALLKSQTKSSSSVTSDLVSDILNNCAQKKIEIDPKKIDTVEKTKPNLETSQELNKKESANNQTQARNVHAKNRKEPQILPKQEKDAITMITKITDEKKVTEKLLQKQLENVDSASNVVNGNIKNNSLASFNTNKEKNKKKQSNILDRVEEFQKNGININFSWEEARCKPCNEIILFEASAIEKHIGVHKANQKIVKTNIKKSEIKKLDNVNDKQAKGQANENKKHSNKLNAKEKPDPRKDLAVFAKENQMVILPNEAYCPHCKIGFKLDMQAMIAHVNLTSHRKNRPLLGNNTLEFIESIVRLESSLGYEVVVNDKYLLGQNSFHCVILGQDCYMCMVCKVESLMQGEMLTRHINEPNHKKKLSICRIVTSLPDEFIREINPNVYHCGFCNEVCYDWVGMEAHLTKLSHMHVSRQAKWNLERCRSVIKNSPVMHVSNMVNINYT